MDIPIQIQDAHERRQGRGESKIKIFKGIYLYIVIVTLFSAYLINNNLQLRQQIHEGTKISLNLQLDLKQHTDNAKNLQIQLNKQSDFETNLQFEIKQQTDIATNLQVQINQLINNNKELQIKLDHKEEKILELKQDKNELSQHLKSFSEKPTTNTNNFSGSENKVHHGSGNIQNLADPITSVETKKEILDAIGKANISDKFKKEAKRVNDQVENAAKKAEGQIKAEAKRFFKKIFSN